MRLPTAHTVRKTRFRKHSGSVPQASFSPNGATGQNRTTGGKHVTSDRHRPRPRRSGTRSGHATGRKAPAAAAWPRPTGSGARFSAGNEPGSGPGYGPRAEPRDPAAGGRTPREPSRRTPRRPVIAAPCRGVASRRRSGGSREDRKRHAARPAAIGPSPRSRRGGPVRSPDAAAGRSG